MKVLLVNPPWHLRRGNIWRDTASVMPPLGLAWIAAVLELHGHQVQILDAHAERCTLEAVRARLAAMGDFDWVGISSTTSLIANALEIVRMAKARWPQSRVAMGGVHPTVLPEEVLAEPAVDVVVRGEGEETMKELVSGADFAGVLGISYRQDTATAGQGRDGPERHGQDAHATHGQDARATGAVRHNEHRPLIADLDSLPMPAYHLLPMARYHPAAGATKRLPAVSMLATRGCVGRCTFCYRIFGPSLRCRSGLALAQEARHLQERYGIREVCFYDDTFTAVKKEIREFCHGLREMKVDLTWSCFSRIDAVDEDTLRAMKEAGCHQIMYGFESASEEILRNVGKRVDLEQAAQAVRITRKVGIDIRAAFMLGNPGETEQTLEETLQYAMRLRPELVIFNITTPFPGTEMFDWADRQGLLKTRDWEDYDLAHAVMDLPTVSAEKVREFYQKAYRRFYLRPRYIAARLASIRSLSDVAQAIRGLRAVAGV
jgi:radical SAM superfamily enzyme YgiQ (UPF0313 family)